MFGEEYDQRRYDEVVRVCALVYDFSLLDDGDLTIVADKGMNLSKGQQARINLARAVYRQANIYLLDDALTALDNHIQDFIFNDCLLNFLKDKICILVSQNPLHIEKANNVIMLNEGRMLFSGDIKEVDRAIVNDLLAKTNKDNEEKSKDALLPNEKKAGLLETEEQQSKKNVYREVKKTGKVNLNIYQQYFQYGGGFIIFGIIILIYIGAQYCDSSSDKLLSKW